MILAENNFAGVSRRTLLTGGLAGGFLLAFHLPVRAEAVNEPVQPPDDTAGKFAPNAFIRIDSAGTTTLVMPQVEMGQGVYTSISMILAEELDADFARVALEHAPPSDKLYGNPMFGIQATGNSNSIRAWWPHLRTAGAGARAMLVQAAAKQWQVDPASCTTANSEVTHKESGRKLSYGELALAASSEVPPKDVPLKDPKDFVLIGKPLKRLDTPDKVNGKAVYGIDAMLPNMKFATMKACPVFGGKVAQGRRQRGEKNSGRAEDRGVRRFRRRGRRSHVGGQAGPRCAGDRLGRRTECAPELRAISGATCAPPAKRTARSPNPTGDIAKGLATGDRLEAAYELPFLAHATMEPINATVHLTADSLRDLDRHAGHDPGAVGSGEGGRPAGREGDRQQPSARRRLWPQARARHGGRGGAYRQAGRWAGQGGVDPRGGYPARRLSSGLSRHHRRDARRRQDRRLEVSRQRLVDHGALVSGRIPEGRRHRRRR